MADQGKATTRFAFLAAALIAVAALLAGSFTPSGEAGPGPVAAAGRTPGPNKTPKPKPSASPTATPTATPVVTPSPTPTATPTPPSLTQLSSDPYANTTSQHATEVEPDVVAFGSTIVAAFQVGRFFDGGSSNVGWATSTNGGSSWTNGFLPGITKIANAANPYDRATDPAVAYDAKHNVWMISTLALTSGGGVKGAAVLTSRSTDGGLTWGNPIVVSAASGSSDYDKNWIGCDDFVASPFYGNCYTAWDDPGFGNRVLLSTSSDGGLTWGPALTNNVSVIGVQPVVQPNGTVVVVTDNGSESAVLAFRSTNGGASWGSATTVSTIQSHNVAGGLRDPALVSSGADASGRIYTAWADCRFRANCASNDIVYSTSNDGVTWTLVARVPIDPTNSGADHFLPGLGVDPSTSGGSAKLGLVYYFYPSAVCTSATCQLQVGFVSSANGGGAWSAPTTLAGPMTLSWIASTSQGTMVGDYFATAVSGGVAWPVFAVASAPSGGVFNEAMYTVSGGVATSGGSIVNTATAVATAHGQPTSNLHRR